MKNHTDLLNLIAKKIKAKSYLEIGTFNPDHNFNKIEVEKKVSIDPDPKAGAMIKLTSDEYFALFKRKFDLIFIDGLHEKEQVKRDIENSSRCLNKGGAIVVHDVNPHSERITHYPRDNGEWCGNVYQTAANVLSEGMFTVDFDYGCMVITKPVMFENVDRDFGSFWTNKGDLLNLKSVEQSIKIIESW